MRRSFFITLALVFFVLGILCTGSVATEKGPIKVGWIGPMSGPWAQIGKDMTNGIEMYFEEVGYKAAGREIQLIVEDGRAVADTTVTKFRKLVTHDKAAVVSGIVAAPCGVASSATADLLETPLIIAICSVDDITQRKRGKWTTRIANSASQVMYPFGSWVYENLGYKRVATIAMDFQYGYDTVGAFQRTFEEAGGQIIQKMWTPQFTVEFGPYIASIKEDTDAVFVCLGGGEALKFPKQYAQSGLKIPLFGSSVTCDEFILPAQGDEILGFVSATVYSGALDIPANKKFQEKYQKRYGKVGSFYACHSYEAGMWIVQAIEAVQGNVEDKESFLKAIKSVRLVDSPRGPFAMDDYGNPICNLYVRKVEKVKDHPLDFMGGGQRKWNSVIDTIPDVSQFYRWDPEEYMKQPRYSQGYPRCKYCK
jgi:branched-chain amino acid transport system substrate-binding protein